MEGKVFSTGNSTVAQLPVGAQLEVVGQGQVRVVSVPAPVYRAGDRVISKYGVGTVVRVTTTDGLDELVAENASDKVVYIADGTNVVRVASPENLKKVVSQLG